MSRDHLRKIATLSATMALHAIVLLAFLGRIPLGVRPLEPLNAHSITRVQELQGLLVSVASLDTHATISNHTSFGLSAHFPLKPVPIAAPRIVSFAFSEEDAQASAGPLPAIGAAGAQCEVHIHQSDTGQVQAIDFGFCTGEAEWQGALVHTLQQAAKLVRPAEGALFPPVRTFIVSTDSLSAAVLAGQLSLGDSPESPSLN